MTNKTRIQKLVFLFASLLFACSNADQVAPVGQLLPAEVDPDAERKRLQEMQYLIVKSADPEDTRQEVWDLSDSGAELTMAFVIAEREDDWTECAVANWDAGDTDDCSDWMCGLRTYLAQPARLMRASEGASVIGIDLDAEMTTRRQPHLRGPAYFDNSDIMIPPQAAAVRAKMADFAAFWYRDLLSNARRTLVNPEEFASDCPAEKYEELAAAAASTMREALIGLEKATYETARLTAAAADKQLGSSTQPAISTARAFVGEELSRAAAAHTLLGGTWGVEGNTTKALCSTTELTAETQEAIDVIRLLAPPPTEIVGIAQELQGGTDTGRLDTFLNGTASWGSLRQRFEQFHGGVTPIDTIEGHFALRTTDFGFAVKYLAQEFKAFVRSLDVPVSGGNPAWFTRYAAVANPPIDPPDAYWGALTRTHIPLNGTDSPTVFNSQEWRTVSSDDPWPTTGFLRNLPIHYANAAMQTVRWASEVMPEVSDDARDVLSSLIDASKVLGAFEHRAPPAPATPAETPDQFGVQLFRDDGRQYYLAIGDEAMRCAAQGSIEGEPCDPWLSAGSSSPRMFTLVDAPDLVASGFSVARFSPLLRAGQRRVYLLTTRVGWAATAEEQTPGAGDFAALVGMAAHRPAPGPGPSTQIKRIGLSPSVERRAAQYMKLSLNDCTRPQLSCAASSDDGSNLGRFDERLPLENDLSDDGDGIESSWRYYLTQARNAAQESDLLAKEYIQTSLARSTRVESEDRRAADIERAQEEKAIAALDRVQEICATSADPRQILDKIDWFGGMGSCEPGDPTPANWECVNGVWVASMERLARDNVDPELRKLGQCLVESELATDFQMSKSNLCYRTDAAGGICQGPGPGVCPLGVEGTTCPDGYDEFIAKEEGLEAFELPKQPDAAGGEDLCDSVRAVRHYASTGGLAVDDPRYEALRKVAKSAIYNIPALAEIRNSLSVQATYGGYVSVNQGGKKWLSTGAAVDGPKVGSWPCTNSAGETPDAPADCGAMGGFRCDSYDCNDYAQRSLLNDRLVNAFIALEITSQGEVFPTRPDLESHIEFWLPTLVARGLMPQDFQRTPRDFVGGSSVYEWWNAQWKLYSPNGPLTPEMSAQMYTRGTFSPGVTGEVAGSTPFAYNLAFRRWNSGAVVKTPNIGSIFFSGLDSVGAGAPGYFVSRLNGMAHTQSIPKPVQLILQLPYSDAVSPLVNYRSEEVDVFPIGERSVCENLPEVIFFGIEIGERPLTDQQLEALTNRLHEDQLSFDVDDKVPATAGSSPLCHSGGAVRPIGADLDLWQNEEALWDAFELVCEANTAVTSASVVDCSQPLAAQSVEDLDQVAAYMDCVADTVAYRATNTILSDVPLEVVTGIKSPSVAAVSGELGNIYSEMRDMLMKLGETGPEFARIFRGFAVELRQVQARIRQQELQDQLSDLDFASKASDRLTACAVAISDASGWLHNISTFGAHWSGVAMTCMNSANQVSVADRMRDAAKDISEEQRKIIFGDAETEVLRLEQAIAAEASEVNSLLEGLQRSLGRIEGVQAEASRRLQEAVWFLNYEDAREEVIDNVMQADEVTAQQRYQRAHENAQRWSFLARRAIEQRLGVDLASIREDMPLVEAPQKWVDSVCATMPVAYSEINPTYGYADAFIGDYVGKLENVVESYRLQFGFQEGADVAVVSLRDDVMNVRAGCEVSSTNLLFQSAAFGEGSLAAESTEDEWQILGCPDPADGNGLGIDSACLAAEEVDSPFQVPSMADAGIRGYQITFSDGTSDCSVNPEVEDEEEVTGGCSWTPATRLTQKRALLPGLYRFSWHSPPAEGGGVGLGRYAGAVWDEAGEEIVPRAGVALVEGIAGRVWDRHYLEFELDQPTTVEVGFARGDDTVLAAWEDEWVVTVGAPMLDEVETQVPVADRAPKAFQATSDTLTVMSNECEDTDGEVFRTRWDRTCERICPEGFGGVCPEDSVEQCYRETSFFISQRSIQAGKSFIQSGFALGNFNYRLDNVAINFVGTGLRSCEDSDSPSTCFSGGFVPYSLYHKGPYFVHNHYGQDYQAHLFEGTIEHARGLAAERYLSNPISSTDRELLTDYMRTEYQGRPMDGHFVLRVWEEPEVDFAALQDVQLILDYQYWSR